MGRGDRVLALINTTCVCVVMEDQVFALIIIMCVPLCGKRLSACNNYYDMFVCEGKGMEFSLMLRVRVGTKDRVLTLIYIMCGKGIMSAYTSYVYVWKGRCVGRGDRVLVLINTTCVCLKERTSACSY